MGINDFDGLIVVDAQPDFFNEHPLVQKVIQNIKKNVYLAMENGLPIFFITKREKVNDGKGIIIGDDSEIVIESIEDMILKRGYKNVYYLSKEGTPLLEKSNDGKILNISDLEKIENIFKNVNSPLISGCFTLACEFAVARDLIDNNINNPKIHYSSSHDGEGSGNSQFIESEFTRFGYKGLLLDEEFNL